MKDGAHQPRPTILGILGEYSRRGKAKRGDDLLANVSSVPGRRMARRAVPGRGARLPAGDLREATGRASPGRAGGTPGSAIAGEGLAEARQGCG